MWSLKFPYRTEKHTKPVVIRNDCYKKLPEDQQQKFAHDPQLNTPTHEVRRDEDDDEAFVLGALVLGGIAVSLSDNDNASSSGSDFTSSDTSSDTWSVSGGDFGGGDGGGGGASGDF